MAGPIIVQNQCREYPSGLRDRPIYGASSGRFQAGGPRYKPAGPSHHRMAWRANYWIIGFRVRSLPGAMVRSVSNGDGDLASPADPPETNRKPRNIQKIERSPHPFDQAPERRRRSELAARRSESGMRRSGYATYRFGGSPDSPDDSENSASGIKPIRALTLFIANSIHARRLIVPSFVIIVSQCLASDIVLCRFCLLTAE